MLQPDVWGATSLEVAKMAAHGGWLAHQLKKWTCTLIADHEALPRNIYGWWNTSLLQDEDLAQKIHLHLQGIGNFVNGMEIICYLDTPEMKASLKLKKGISRVMVQQWMRIMDY